jgi:hypothetical protein
VTNEHLDSALVGIIRHALIKNLNEARLFFKGAKQFTDVLSPRKLGFSENIRSTIEIYFGSVPFFVLQTPLA